MPINTKTKVLTHLFDSSRYRSNNFILIQKNKWLLGSIPSFFVLFFLFLFDLIYICFMLETMLFNLIS